MKIKINYQLYGEFRYNIKENNEIIYRSDWAPNLILDAGIRDIAQQVTYNVYDGNTIENLISNISFGLSDEDLENATRTSLVSSIPSLSADYLGFSGLGAYSYQNFLSGDSVVHDVAFFTTRASDTLNLKEFLVYGPKTVAFARKSIDITLQRYQSIDFFYRLYVKWPRQVNVSTARIINYNTSATYALSTVLYNIPSRTKLFSKDTSIIANKSNSFEQFPQTATTYPVYIQPSNGSLQYSSFTSTLMSRTSASINIVYPVSCKLVQTFPFTTYFDELIFSWDGQYSDNQSYYAAARLGTNINLYTGLTA